MIPERFFGLTITHQLELQSEARERILSVIKERENPVKPQTLIRLSVKSPTRRLPEYIVKRAVWSIIADDIAHFTDENKIELTRRD